MAKRRVKKRTHAGAPGTKPAPGAGAARPGDRSPRSMVIRIGAGEVGPSVSQLVHDVRSMLEPGTAARLKERKSNKLRDFTTMAGPLGVTHLLLFSRSEAGNTNLRLAVTPRGPTLHFRIPKYSLCKDVLKSMKHAKSGGADYLTPPLLVMNNFNTPASDTAQSNAVPKHLESLTTTIFQSLFAPISPQHTSLKSIKRVMLLDRINKPSSDPSEQAPYLLQLRHYAIATPVAKSSMPKPLRRLNAATQSMHSQKRALPNLGKLEDVSDYLLDPSATAGFTSASESEGETDAEVEVLAPESRRVISAEERRQMREAQKARINGNNGDAEHVVHRAPSKGKTHSMIEKRAIKLTELGPRMTLRLTKVEEGLCGGKIMWHEYIQKTKTEEKEMETIWAQRKKEKEERRRVQKENVDKKRKERGAGKGDKDEGDDEEMEDDDEDDEDDVWDDEDMNDEDGGVEMEVEGDDEDENDD